MRTDVAGGAWGTDDRITFGRAGALWQISATGGAVYAVDGNSTGERASSRIDGRQSSRTARSSRSPWFVTGSARAAAHIEALTLATGTRQILCFDPGIVPTWYRAERASDLFPR